MVSKTSSLEFLPSAWSRTLPAPTRGTAIEPLGHSRLSLGLDASPSTDMEATLTTLETLKDEHTSGSKRSVPSSKYSPTGARDEES